MDNSKISYGRRIDVENSNSFRLPQRNQIETVETTHHANHVNVFLALWRHVFVMRLDLLEFGERSILITIIGAVENIFRMVIVHLTIECSWCLCAHGTPLSFRTRTLH